MTDRLPWYHDEDHEHELTASSVTHSPAAHHKEALGDDGGGDDHGDDHGDDNGDDRGDDNVDDNGDDHGEHYHIMVMNTSLVAHSPTAHHREVQCKASKPSFFFFFFCISF